MALESEADRLAFFSAAEFGSAATVGANTIYGIFTDPPATDLEIDGHAPEFRCRTTDAANIALAATVVIGGVNYKAVRKLASGDGMTTVRLETA
jgi:hypothetical protein